MQYVHIMHEGKSVWGILEGCGIKLLSSAPWLGGGPTGEQITHDPAALLPACAPRNIVCVGKNYRDHAYEMGSDAPDHPIIFLKPTTALLPPGGKITYPCGVNRVDYEGELAFVVGKTARHVAQADAYEYIFGYTCLNDVTARELQSLDGQWMRAKGHDTFAPVGPYLVSGIDPGDLKLETRLNGQVRQSGRTSELIFPIPVLMSFITGFMTLHPGDIVATGTPAGIGPMRPGDQVSIEIEKVGILTNTVVGE